MIDSFVHSGIIFGTTISVFLIFFLKKEIKSKHSWKSRKNDIIVSQQIKKSSVSFFSKIISVFFDSEASLSLNLFRLKYKKIYIILYVMFSLFFIVFLGINQIFPQLFTHSYWFYVVYSFSFGSFIGQIGLFFFYLVGFGDSSGSDWGDSGGGDDSGGGFSGGGGDSGGGGAGD